MTMKHTEIDGKKYTAKHAEDGSIVLTPFPKLKGKHGDVTTTIKSIGPRLCLSGDMFWIGDGENEPSDTPFGEAYREEFAFNIFDVLNGKYVRKQDVIDALRHKDLEGKDVLYWIRKNQTTQNYYGAGESYEALRDLGIIKD